MLLDIAKLLLQKKIVNYQNIKDVLEVEKAITIKSFKDSLINKGLVEKDFLEEEIRKNFGANIEDIKDIKVDEEILSLIRKETATVNLVLPIRIENEKLVVAMADPSDLFLLDQLGFESGYGIAPVMASKETIRNAVIKNYKVDFNDQHIEIKTLDFSNSAESIISKLEEFENGNANKAAEFETPQTQPEPKIESNESQDEEISLELETEIHEIENSSTTENNLSENPDPFKSSLSISASEKDEPKQDSSNPFQSAEVQSMAEEPEHIEEYEKAAETEVGSKSPFSSAVSSVDKTDLASELIEEPTSTFFKETVAEKTIENEIKAEELKKEVEPLDEEHNENQTSPFASAFSAVGKEDSDEAVDVTEELSPSVHNVKTEENDGSNDVEVEELKADEKISEENSNEFNPFASGVAKADESTPQDNPFDEPSMEEVFDKTEAEVEQKSFKDNIDITKDEEQNEPALSNISILIVDKSTTMRRVMTQTLEKKGYNIINSDNAIDAISKINSNKPDLIVLDTKLPHIDGYQLCKTIKKNADTKDIPIVMLSGKDGLFDKMKGKMSGANEYIAKPFKPNRLISVIEKLVAP